MRHRSTKSILDRKQAPRQAMLENLAASLVLYEKVQTTAGKARALRPLVEKLITKGKVKSLITKRALAAVLPEKTAVKKVLEVLGPRYATRPGGYTRTIKLGARKGDGAMMVQIELVK